MSLLVAGLVTVGAIVLTWGPLSARTDDIGYPVFTDFNPYKYFRAYYLAVGFFPIAALLLFLALTRVGPRLGLAVPGPRGSLRPGAVEEAELDPPAPVAAQWPWSSAIRIGFVGAVVGLEAGIATNHSWRGIVAALIAYPLAVGLGATALRCFAPAWDLPDRLRAVNAAGAALTILGLAAVSSVTGVRIQSNGSTHHYPWFPLWLALPVALAVVALIVRRLRRAAEGGAERVERWALLLAAAPAYLVVLIAALPGDLSGFDTFERGQSLAVTRLVGDGFLPWRDVVAAHGVMLDVVHPAVGFALFGDSAWGSLAGYGMVLGPLYMALLFAVFAHLFWRNPPFLLFAGLVMIGTTLILPDSRFLLWPPTLLLLARVLRRPSPAWATALAFIVALDAIVTPESTPSVIAVTAVVVAYEWYWRRPRTTLRGAFPRSLWLIGSGFCFAAAFATYMASRGGLDDFLYITTSLIHGHILDGALPPGPNGSPLSQLQFDFLALAPPAAILVSFAYAVARLRSRRPFRTDDWVVAAFGLFCLLYYPKFLARMDNHVYQPFGVALPLMLYVLYRWIESGERAIRGRWPAARLSRVAHPLTLGAVVVVAGLSFGILRDRVANSPGRYRPAVGAPPQLAKVGYATSVNVAGFGDLGQVLDAYLRPADRIFDLSGEPALFFYLFDRYPATRFPLANGVADNSELQSDIVDQLRRNRPKLIVFDNTDTTYQGLANFDGVPAPVRLYLVSRWILDHYKPLLTVDGHTFYARPDLPAAPRAPLRLSMRLQTGRIEFLTQPCNWGDSPTFLGGPAQPPASAKGVGARAHPPRAGRLAILGWAGDPQTKRPAPEVIAVDHGRVVGRTTPTLDRPDLVAFGLPGGYRRAGFRLSLPVARVSSPRDLQLFAISATGKLTEIVAQGARPLTGTVPIGGDERPITPDALQGQLNSVVDPPALQIDPPPGSRWSDYRWLEVDAGPKGFDDAPFTLANSQRPTIPGTEIQFTTLDRSPSRIVIPVSSCAQWRGYGAAPLYLDSVPRQDVAAVRLIR